MVERKVIRQGDVVFIPIAEVPKKAKSAKRVDKILALGEVSGHHHRFDMAAPVQVYGAQTAESQFIDVKEQSTILHEEHKPLEIPAGVWEVKIARELDIMNEVRRVSD
jgi:hypothetical protein